MIKQSFKILILFQIKVVMNIVQNFLIQPK